MVYPGAGIALSTGSAWGTSITNNSANWNTAYGWGNHASAGYATTSALTTHANLTTTAHGLGASAFHADSYFALAGHNHSGVYELVITAGTSAQYWRGDKSWQAFPTTMTPSAHNLIDTTNHPVSGLTAGHFLKATGATTYGFAAHGLTYSDVGAAASGHEHAGLYYSLVTGITIDSDGVIVASDDAFYIGAKATDGTWRIVRNGNDLEIQRRESGSYVMKGKISA
jgi:hypothetical protein